jgi:pimeloyl-ACP methyl ester carboxylesterase
MKVMLGGSTRAWLLLVLLVVNATTAAAHGTTSPPTDEVTGHTLVVDGLKIFYREAGKVTSPTLVLLHGTDSSSFSFRNLIPRLAGQFHVLAPDYVGFGYSDIPGVDSYDYSFDHIAETMDDFLGAVGANRYILYMHDYGAPVGFRLALRHPERISGLVIQNANAYEAGLNPEWRAALEKQIEQGGTQPPAAAEQPQTPPSIDTSIEAARRFHATGAHNAATMSPDGYTFDTLMDLRAGRTEVEDALERDYYRNVMQYPAWQQWLRTARPRILIVWGKNDAIFGIEGAKSYLRDVPQGKLVLFDGNHFLLEEYASAVGKEITAYFKRGAR